MNRYDLMISLTKVCRYVDRASLAIVAALFMVLLGYGIGLLDSASGATAQDQRMMIFMVAVSVVVGGAFGTVAKRSAPAQGLAAGAGAGLFLISGVLSIGSLAVSDSLGKPLPAMLLPAAGIVFVIGLLADITWAIVRRVLRKNAAATC